MNARTSATGIPVRADCSWAANNCRAEVIAAERASRPRDAPVPAMLTP
jgi:hypothetical protein